MNKLEGEYNNLTNQPEKPYPEGGGNLMAENGENPMRVNETGLAPKDLLNRKDLPVDVRRVLGEVVGERGTEKAKEVMKNAALGDRERIDKANQLLKRDLTKGEREAILQAHNQGKGEIGKDNNPAGIYNYTEGQLLRKVRILNKAGFSEEDQRVLMEAGLVGRPVDPVDMVGISDPKIVAEMEAMNNSLDIEVQPSLNTLYEALNGVSRLVGVNPAEKQKAITRIKERLVKEKESVDKEQAKNQEKQDVTYRFGLSLMKEEMDALMTTPMEWLNGQFDHVYALAEGGQELNSPLIQNTQNKIAYAIDLINASNPEHLKSFIDESTVHLHLLQMRTAIGLKDMDQIKGAAGQLRAHGLLLGMQLEDGKVGAMFNRFQDKLEETRQWSNRRHHVMLEDVLKVQKALINEQMKWAENGKGSFGDLSDIAKKSEYQTDFISATQDENMTNLKIKKDEKAIEEVLRAGKLTDVERVQANKELERLGRITRMKKVNADITRTVRTAYDVFVSSQRMGVVVSRGKYLLKGQSRYRSDPIGPLNVYNMEDLTINRFDIYSPQQEESINRMKLEMAENYLKEQREIPGGNQKELTREQKIDLGQRLFRDLFAVPDFFSSGWRIEGVIQALEQRFESSALQGKPLDQLLNPEEMKNYQELQSESERKKIEAKRRAEDFALFMRLRLSGQEQVSRSAYKKGIVETREEREKIWGKIKDYRPEEIIRLFRERKSDKIKGLYGEMVKIDPNLDLNKEEKLANRPDDEGGRGRDLTVYDKFKQKYGAVIGLLRQEGFSRIKGGIPVPEQVNLAKLGNKTGLPEDIKFREKQRDIVNKFLKDDKGAKRLIELAEKMQNFIDPNPPTKDGDEVKNTERKRTLIDDLLTDNEFADIYTRSLIVDDALLDKLEDEKPDVIGELGVSELGYVPFSKLIGEAGAGNDALTRSWSDTGNAIEAGNTLVNGFIKEEDLKKKTEAALKFASLAASYNGLGSRGQAECVRYTIGTHLNLSKLDMVWDIIGINTLPFRIPASEAQRIFGVQADAIGRDELRESVDHLRGYMNSSISKAREAFKERKKEILESELSKKNRKDAKELILSAEDKEKIKNMNLSEEEKFKEDKFQAEAIRLNLSGDELTKDILIRDLEEKLKKDEVDSHKFYKDLEDILEVNADDFWKRTGFRFILYLMLAAIGESYKVGESSFKDVSK